MARTDKDRPWWVQVLQDENYIAHDHRNGVCIPETADYVVGRNGGSYSRHTHWRHCRKRTRVVEYCTKRDPHVVSSRYWRTRQECWTHRCRCGLPPYQRHDNAYVCPTWGRVQCDGHERVVYDDSIPCVCDDWPEPPTCSLELRDPTRLRWLSGGIPTWFVRQHYHRPERARERKLNDVRREYNAGEDIDGYDFENRQARGSARWAWW